MKISLIYLPFDLFCDNNNYSKDIKISSKTREKLLHGTAKTAFRLTRIR